MKYEYGKVTKGVSGEDAERTERALKLYKEPEEFNKDSKKEILQYALGGLLYMPASNTKIAKKIISGEYGFIKSMVLDLEDSLGDDMVGFGQSNIVNVITELEDAIKAGEFSYDNVPLIFIRVREHGQMKKTLDMLGDKIQYITGFNIPKFDKSCCDKYIEEFREVADEVNNLFKFMKKLYIMPIIENKLAMYRQLRMDNLLYINNALRPISDYVLNIRVGGADFCSIFGIRRNIDEVIEDIGVVRSVFADIINVFGKSYVVSGPVWEYFERPNEESDGAWKVGLERELKADKLNGFIGKTSIHPSQLPVIQESLIVSKRDYIDAMSILGMNVNTTGVKKGTDDGHGNYRMNEVKTHTNWAKKIVNLAYIFGVKEDNV